MTTENIPKEKIASMLSQEKWLSAHDVKRTLKLKASVKSVGKLLANAIGNDPGIECVRVNNVRQYRIKGPFATKVEAPLATEDVSIMTEIKEYIKDALEYRRMMTEYRAMKEAMKQQLKNVKTRGAVGI